jgi:MurNAc alpha-1-phosphate uridylyltransferase
MRPLTDHTPKPLLRVGGKPLIVWHIERLVRAGICEIIINHAHLGMQIEALLRDGIQFGAQLRYSPEATALETAGGIAYALPLLGNNPFAVVNGDIYCDYDFACFPEIADRLLSNNDAAHLVLVDNPPHHPNGDFPLHRGRIEDHNDLCYTFSGIGIYQPALFSPVTRGDKAPLAPLLREQIALGRVSGEHFTGRWVDVGTPQRLQELDNELQASQNTHHA